MTPELVIKVTKISNRWHARFMLKSKVLDEMACANSYDIGWICREMLRQYDKMGGESLFATAARERQQASPKGKVWSKKQLDATITRGE